MEEKNEIALNEKVQELVKSSYDTAVTFPKHNEMVNDAAESLKISVAEIRHRIKKFEDSTSQPSLFKINDAQEKKFRKIMSNTNIFFLRV